MQNEISKEKINLIEEDTIKSMIKIIRGVPVLLDSELAKIYQCTNGTKDINKAVARNKERFPEDFYFKLDENEYEFLRFQNGTLKRNGQGQHIKYLPHVFTEQGVAMLATVLKTKAATIASVNIMRAFVAMRKFIMENNDLYKSITNINNKLLEHDSTLKELQKFFLKYDKKEQLLLSNKPYTATSTIIDIFNRAKKRIVIVDSYVDKTLLDLISNINCKIMIVTSKKSKITVTEIEKFNKEYNNRLIIDYSEKFHDRFIIIDDNEVYLSGTSINYIGSKISMLIKINDSNLKNQITKEIYNN